MSKTPAEELRRSILSSLPNDPFQTTEPDPRFTYLPDNHVRALDPDNMLVVGARGTGKSFWWNALLSDSVRKTLVDRAPSMQRGTISVSTGWSEQEREAFPNKDTLSQLREAGHEPRLIWKAVTLGQIAPETFASSELRRWAPRVEWVRHHPEEVADRLRARDQELASRNERQLILFDALDRTADTFAERRALLRGLLQLVLDLRSTRAIRAKVFVRGDMIEDPEVTAFPDGVKVAATRVELAWPRRELYALLWQYLGNAGEGGADFRAQAPGWTSNGEIYRMPEALRTEETVQRRVFAAVAGTAMGTNERRGLPYTWIPTHLGDAKGVATPRSFLAAILTAAAEAPSSGPHALHWRSILQGVQKASEFRVREIADDFPWATPAMGALKYLQVPCERSAIMQRWNLNRVLQAIQGQKEGRTNMRLELGAAGVLLDLAEIGVLEVRSDRRYNVPDVYRVGFGMRRKGGVRPVQ